MTITSQSPASTCQVAATRRGSIMSIRITAAIVLVIVAIAMLVTSAGVEAAGSRHLAIALIVSGAVTAALAGMVAVGDVARTHHRAARTHHRRK